MRRLALSLFLAVCASAAPAAADPSAAARAWDSPCVKWFGIGVIPRLEHASRLTRIMSDTWSGVICSGSTEVGTFSMQFAYDGTGFVGGTWSSSLYGGGATQQGVLVNFEEYPAGTTFDMTSSANDPCRYTLLLGIGPWRRETLFLIGETGCATSIEGHPVAFVVESNSR